MANPASGEGTLRVENSRFRSSRIKLYISEAFSQFGDQMWSFSIALFLLELWPGSLRVPAVYIFATQLNALVFCPVVGRWIDRTSRLKAAVTSLVIQNSAVLLTSALLIVAFTCKGSECESWMLYSLTCGVIAVAAIGLVFSTSLCIVLEQDWIIVMCCADADELADANANLRRIGLLCKLLGPICIGFMMTICRERLSLVIIACWNLGSLILEFCVLRNIYRSLPELAVKPVQPIAAAAADPNETIALQSNISPIVTDGNLVNPTSQRKTWPKFVSSTISGWRDYFQQPITLAGLSLALLYCTVLGFDGITNTYIASQGVSDAVTAVAMALGALSGFAGTLIYPSMRRAIGLERTGLYAFAFQSTCMAVCVASIFLPGSPFYLCRLAYAENANQSLVNAESSNFSTLLITDDNNSFISFVFPKHKGSFMSISVFLAALIVSRSGLWVADITVTQLFQENVSPTKRGAVNGVQASMNQMFDMLKNIMVIAMPDVHTFGWLICLSCIAVFLGYCCFSAYPFRIRGHSLPHRSYASSFRQSVGQREV